MVAKELKTKKKNRERTTERAALSLELPAVKRRTCGILCGRCCRLAVRHDDEAADRAAVLRSNGLNLDAIVIVSDRVVREGEVPS